MDKAALAVVGVLGAGLLAWLGWRAHVRAGLPGSVEPAEGGKDEAPAGSVDASETPGEDRGT